MTLLERSLLLELAAPFLLGVAAFTGILLSSTVLFPLVTEVVRHGVAGWQVLEIVLLRLPETAFYTFPMSTLLASLLAYGRLAGDGELTAWRGLGLSPWRLLRPALSFALVVAVATIALNEGVVPVAAWQAKGLLLAATHRSPLPRAQEHLFFPEREGGQLKRYFYARRFDGRAMADVVLQEFEAGRLVRIVQAQVAEPLAAGWRFQQGVVHQVDALGEFRYTLRFTEQQVELGTDLLAMALENRQPLEMNARELAEHTARLRRAGVGERELGELDVLRHQRLAIPCAALVFALLGAGVGIRPSPAGATMGLGISILLIFAYYVLMFLGMAGGQLGWLAPWFAAWLPNLAAGALGAWRVGRWVARVP
ncbi:MAG: LptF/LptG family permease [Candidatus Sericytochromatia bacterium]|nr:LptF/LptG family permease [Candidatus Sericytochromatia bacterium]